MSPQTKFPLVGWLLMGLGWPMAARRVPPNRWYGLRVPATFADERVWYEANAAAGRDMMILAAVIVVVALVLVRLVDLSDSSYSGVCAGLLGVGALTLTVRGWRAANRMLRERQHEPSREPR
jgi:SdpI/YfhL protein family